MNAVAKPGRAKQQPSSSDDDGDSGDGGSDDGSSSSSGSDDDERTLEEQMADVPLEMLEAIRQDGRGLVGQAARAEAYRAKEKKFKREHKDRPQEVSSKRAVARFREVMQAPHSERRDPRFDSGPSAGAGPSSSTADASRSRYSFLFNDMLPREKADLQAKIKKESNPKFKARLQAQLQRVEQSLKDEDLRRRTSALEKDWKAKERAAVAAGKKPYFLKDSERKRLALLAKYQALQERGKLDKFMEKRRKKNAAKDHRYLPSGRRPAQDS